MPQTSQTFAYNQLFELMKLEVTRRQYLDSKASTYIGLLSIAVTVLTAFGGILVFRGGQIQEIKAQQQLISNELGVLISILYLLIVFCFVMGVIFAFYAFSTGSKNVPLNTKESNHIKKYIYIFMNYLRPSYAFSWDDSEKNYRKLKRFLARKFDINWIKDAKIARNNNGKTIIVFKGGKNDLYLKLNNEHTEAIAEIETDMTYEFTARIENGKLNIYDPQRDDMYQGVGIDYIVNNTSAYLFKVQNGLILELREIIRINRNLNNMKSNRVLDAYRYTKWGIYLLLILSLVIGLLNLRILR